MTTQNTTIWLGKYEYFELPSLEPDSIKDAPGNYVMGKPLGLGKWAAVYAGSTPNGGTLRQRIPGHEKWLDAIALGATTIWAHVNHDPVSMAAEERDLIATLNPPLNVQHRTIPTESEGLFGRRGF